MDIKLEAHRLLSAVVAFVFMFLCFYCRRRRLLAALQSSTLSRQFNKKWSKYFIIPTTFALKLASYLKETRLRMRISWAASSLFRICQWLNVSRHAITQVKSPVHAPRFPDGLIPSTIFTASHENWPDLLPSVESSINLYAEAVMEKYYLPSLKVNSSDGFITLRISPFFLCVVVLFLFFVFILADAFL